MSVNVQVIRDAEHARVRVVVRVAPVAVVTAAVVVALPDDDDDERRTKATIIKARRTWLLVPLEVWLYEPYDELGIVDVRGGRTRAGSR